MRIPVTVVTGFLGSGKTTLLNRALRDPQLERTVVIVNEFGDIGLDHELIEASSDAVVLLDNGCLCCSVRGDLVDTLVDLQQKRMQRLVPGFDQVVIETSGLAEPTPIAEVIGSEPAVQAAYALAGIVTTVDAVNGMATLDAHEQSIKQAALADRIVLTKGDLGEASAELLARLRVLNPDAEILDVRQADPGALIRLGTTGEPTIRIRTAADGGASHGGHGHDARIKRFSIVRETPWDQATLRLLLDVLATNAGPALLRVKGIVGVEEFPDRPAVIHGAQQLVHSLDWLDCWPSGDRRTRIVFITMDWGFEDAEELVADVERLARRTKAARERAAGRV